MATAISIHTVIRSSTIESVGTVEIFTGSEFVECYGILAGTLAIGVVVVTHVVVAVERIDIFGCFSDDAFHFGLHCLEFVDSTAEFEHFRSIVNDFIVLVEHLLGREHTGIRTSGIVITHSIGNGAVEVHPCFFILCEFYFFQIPAGTYLVTGLGVEFYQLAATDTPAGDRGFGTDEEGLGSRNQQGSVVAVCETAGDISGTRELLGVLAVQDVLITFGIFGTTPVHSTEVVPVVVTTCSPEITSVTTNHLIGIEVGIFTLTHALDVIHAICITCDAEDTVQIALPF